MVEKATELPDLPYDQLIVWCMDVRMGKIAATPKVREQAKVLTFALAYGHIPKQL